MTRLQKKFQYIALIGVLLTVSGCAGYHFPLMPEPVVEGVQKLTAVGYGSPSAYSQYSAGQQKLMAIRAAQVDAYRNLAEQVYGFRLTGASSVSAFATHNHTNRTYVDAFIRGAKVVNTATIADGNVEVTVEIELTPGFLKCMANNGGCGGRYAQASTTGCGVSTCASSSMGGYYVY